MVEGWVSREEIPVLSCTNKTNKFGHICKRKFLASPLSTRQRNLEKEEARDPPTGAKGEEQVSTQLPQLCGLGLKKLICPVSPRVELQGREGGDLERWR